MTDTPDTEARRWIEVLLARVDLLERELAEIKRVLSVGSFVRGGREATPPWTDPSPPTQHVIRNPDITAERQRTGMFGHSPYVPPSK